MNMTQNLIVAVGSGVLLGFFAWWAPFLLATGFVLLGGVTLDVSDDVSVRDGVAEVMAKAGRIDVLVNNAGVGYNATVEDLDIERAKALFETNYWGVIRCAQAVLPQMRARRSGHIVNVSSVAGRISLIGQVAYTSSKWATECLSEHLAQEAAHFGIRVSIIEPGVTRTAMLPKNEDVPNETAYDWAYRREFAFYRSGVTANVQAEVVAETIWVAITALTPKLRYSCAWAGDELAHGHAPMSDEDWVALCSTSTDEAYFAGFRAAFGLDIS
jgi:NAD(P)-dependent dehydrogenase (short-subunit alcohol dehydrogenase family)